MYECRPSGKFNEYIGFITDRQLLDRELWKKCVDVFSSGIDNRDAGWRGEYWGKMMRGACLIYSVSKSAELMEVLTGAVNGLLSKQEESGRISAYRQDDEFNGWDMWSRKYVMTGFQHFYDICGDEELKKRISAALIRHADYIVERIGEGKIGILDTGSFWGGVNSASILEPFVRLYKDTNDKKYLEFAEYIVSTGGCRDGNLIECALKGLAPYEFPEQKAYETMSFFEGILALYEVTGKELYLDAVRKFASALVETDITVIGSCGCTHELFDNSSIRQTEFIDNIMQETCVTVTLIRFLSRLYKLTGEKKLIDAVRIASLNALAGALNVNGYEQLSRERNEYLPGMTFDSYSPLCDSKRGLGIGGFKTFEDGSHFGCCACIASAGFALYPLMCITQDENGFSVNYPVNGRYAFRCADGEIAEFTVDDEGITLSLPGNKSFDIRINTGDDSYRILPSAIGKKRSEDGGFAVFGGEWSNGDRIEIKRESILCEKKLNGKISLSYGGYVLAADTSKTGYVPGKKYAFERDENGNIVYTLLEPEKSEQLRIGINTDSGELVLTDYASSGQDGKSIITVWFAQ